MIDTKHVKIPPLKKVNAPQPKHLPNLYEVVEHYKRKGLLPADTDMTELWAKQAAEAVEHRRRNRVNRRKT
jgi:hypothetical protein